MVQKCTLYIGKTAGLGALYYKISLNRHKVGNLLKKWFYRGMINWKLLTEFEQVGNALTNSAMTKFWNWHNWWFSTRWLIFAGFLSFLYVKNTNKPKNVWNSSDSADRVRETAPPRNNLM